MQSPFPGMDPFIECQEWEDFHSRFNNLLADLLAPQIEPDYITRNTLHDIYNYSLAS